jgi:hypothetical protein
MASQITPSTFVRGITWGNSLVLNAVTSSGVYFNVGDLGENILLVVNASSSDTGALYVLPGARWAGARGQAPSTTVTDYSTATAPIAISVPTHGITGSSAITSTAGSIYMMNLESINVKSSDGTVYLASSTGSTKMYVGVLQLLGGSTQ